MIDKNVLDLDWSLVKHDPTLQSFEILQELVKCGNIKSIKKKKKTKPYISSNVWT